ncbi:MAG: AraC-like DNA-binding protein [Paraglaciecola sp.]|jgi:AraC-like DNA-binding protein
MPGKVITSAAATSFMQQIAEPHLLEMFDLLPDILFWIKDLNSRVMHHNQSYLDHIGGGSSDTVIGKTDMDFLPKHIAKQFIVDDKKVVLGEIVSERLEMNILESGEICWFTTSKRPLFNRKGEIIGSYGCSRHLEKTSIALSGMVALKAPVSFIREHYMDKISMPQLAEVSHLSISALERRFKKFLGKTPQTYITQVRLENAKRLLVETTLPISVVGEEVGFSDPSYFSRKFQQLFEELPSEFRQSFQ